jgi:hypothetical protein
MGPAAIDNAADYTNDGAVVNFFFAIAPSNHKSVAPTEMAFTRLCWPRPNAYLQNEIARPKHAQKICGRFHAQTPL